MRFIDLAHVMGQCTTTPLSVSNHHFASKPFQHADRSVVDISMQSPLRAPCHKRHAFFDRRFRRKHLWIVVPTNGGDLFGCHFDHRTQACIRHKSHKWPRQFCTQKGQTKTCWIGKHLCQNRSQQAFTQRTLVILFDIGTRMINQMHVMHP